MQINVVGLDIAKQVFQVHAVDAEGRMVAQIRLRRGQVLDHFRRCRHAQWLWRLARPRTTGRDS